MQIHHVVGAGALVIAAAAWFGPFRSQRALALEDFCPGGVKPNPRVLLCDDFEDDDAVNEWDIGSNRNTWPHADFVRCTADGFGFHDLCAAWSNQLVFDNAWGFWGYNAVQPFSPQSAFYVRWYQGISDPFKWGTLEDKSVLIQDRGHSILAYVGTNRNQLPVERNSGPGMPFVANYQDLDYPETGNQFTRFNRFQNQGVNIALVPGRWYLFEWYVRLNTPGLSDGETKLWIDDATEPIGRQTLRMHHTDMRWLKRTDGGKQFGEVRLTVYDQRCDIGPNACPPNGPRILDQWHKWDHIVVSRDPIGPLVDAGSVRVRVPRSVP